VNRACACARVKHNGRRNTLVRACYRNAKCQRLRTTTDTPNACSAQACKHASMRPIRPQRVVGSVAHGHVSTATHIATRTSTMMPMCAPASTNGGADACTSSMLAHGRTCAGVVVASTGGATCSRAFRFSAVNLRCTCWIAQQLSAQLAGGCGRMRRTREKQLARKCARRHTRGE